MIETGKLLDQARGRSGLSDFGEETFLEPLARLQGLDEAGPSFLALDPRVVLPEYEAVLPPADRRRLAADENDSLLWLALVRLEGRRVLVNMRAPVVINPRRMIGLQVVPADSPYSTHHELLLG